MTPSSNPQSDEKASETRLLSREAEICGVENMASQVASLLLNASPSSPFCLWLVGDLGVGKTTWTRYFLYALGLDPACPVTSPTFTYVQEYDLPGRNNNSSNNNNRISRKISHYDFYRLPNPNEDGSFAGWSSLMTESGLDDSESGAHCLIEWPERLNEIGLSYFYPTHILEISYLSENKRQYDLWACQTFDSPLLKKILK